jgi:hypothetical protein
LPRSFLKNRSGLSGHVLPSLRERRGVRHDILRRHAVRGVAVSRLFEWLGLAQTAA